MTTLFPVIVKYGFLIVNEIIDIDQDLAFMVTSPTMLVCANTNNPIGFNLN